MPKPVDIVRAECAKRKISIAQFERDCGFGNGYFNPKKLNKISYDRAVIISEKLDLPLSVLIGAEEKKETPAANVGNGVSGRDIRLLEWFRSLPEEKRKAILSLGGAPEDLV